MTTKISLKLKPKLFSYSDYRIYIRDLVHAANEEGHSYRQIVKACGFANPNFFQQVIAAERNLTPETTIKICKAFSLAKAEAAYLALLVKLASPRFANKDKILEEMRRIVFKETSAKLKDASMHSHWLNAVIFEMAALKDLPLTTATIQSYMRGTTNASEVEHALKFLVAKGWLVPTASKDVYERKNVHFEALDDVRRIDLQRNHLQFLDMAKHRINDDIDAREFRGVTAAIPKEKMKDLKIRLRDFMTALRAEVDSYENSDQVVRLQIALFEVAAKK